MMDRILARTAALAVLGVLVASAAPTARAQAQAPDRATLGAQAQAAYLAGDAAAIRICCDDRSLPAAARPLVEFLAARSVPGPPPAPADTPPIAS